MTLQSPSQDAGQRRWVDVAMPWPWLFVLCSAIVVLRRPDAILNAQFWAEDGKIWFANAHNLGAWHAMLLPQNGYLQTLSRLVAAIAVHLPMRLAPLVFNIAAIVVQVLPVLLLNSARGRALVPSPWARLLLGVLYIAQPYTMEVHANLTNAQWHLAVSAVLTCCFSGWRSRWQVVFDIALVAFSCLSGPFCILLLPCVAWLAWRRRDRRTAWLLAVVLAGACLQLALAIPQMGVTRAIGPLGATWQGFFRIAGGQVVMAALLGDSWRHVYLLDAWQGSAVLPLLATAAGAVVFVRAVRSGSDALVGFIAFSGLVFVAALVSPQVSRTGQWVAWQAPHVGERYSLLPVLAFYAALVSIVSRDRLPAARWTAGALLGCVLLVAVPTSWQIRPLKDFAYRQHVEAYRRAGPGEVVRIPTNPSGWTMDLRKPDD